MSKKSKGSSVKKSNKKKPGASVKKNTAKKTASKKPVKKSGGKVKAAKKPATKKTVKKILPKKSAKVSKPVKSLKAKPKPKTVVKKTASPKSKAVSKKKVPASKNSTVKKPVAKLKSNPAKTLKTKQVKSIGKKAVKAENIKGTARAVYEKKAEPAQKKEVTPEVLAEPKKIIPDGKGSAADVLAITNTIPKKEVNPLSASKLASISSAITNPSKRVDSYSIKPEKEPIGKYEMEFVVRSSPEMLYEFLSTPSGLSEWFCDDVNIRNGIYTFIWDGQLQQARLLKTQDDQLVRFQWVDKTDGSYFEFKIQRDDLTNDISLIITDFAETESERESAKLLWQSQVDKLMHIMGSIF